MPYRRADHDSRDSVIRELALLKSAANRRGDTGGNIRGRGRLEGATDAHVLSVRLS